MWIPLNGVIKMYYVFALLITILFVGSSLMVIRSSAFVKLGVIHRVMVLQSIMLIMVALIMVILLIVLK